MNLKLLFIITFSIFIIHAAIDIKPDIKKLKSQTVGPILTAIDENYVLVNYQNIDPLPVKRIDLRRRSKDKIFAAADSRYEEIEYGSTAVYQPLNDDHTMIGKLDTCRDYDNIILRIDSIVSNDISVEYHPDLSKLIEEYSKWICIKNDTLNQLEFNQRRSCLKEGEILLSDGSKYQLSDGIMEVVILPSRQVRLTGLQFMFNTNLKEIAIALSDCTVDYSTYFEDENSSIILLALIATIILVIFLLSLS